MGGFGTSYGDAERRIAIAIKDQIGTIEGGGSGGGGGDASASNQVAIIDAISEASDNQLLQTASINVVRDNQLAQTVVVESIKNRLGSGFTPTGRSSNSSATINEWSEVMPANANRKIWSLQYNPAGSGILEIGGGTLGNEVPIALLTPGSSWFESLPQMVNIGRIVVRSTVTSQSFIAWEA